jgi:hypothetical protein
MNDKLEYVLATIAIAFGSQWAIRFFRSRQAGKNDEIKNLNLIIDRMRLEIDRLEIKIDKMQLEFDNKEAAYHLAYSCPNNVTCPVINKLKKEKPDGKN